MSDPNTEDRPTGCGQAYSIHIYRAAEVTF
jgi:hypothetical protein